MNEIEEAVLCTFKSLVMRQLDVHKMYIIGSRARGDADEESDMDVVVILNRPYNDEQRDYVSDCAWEAGFGYGIVVVPIVFSRQEWEEGPERYSPLGQAVEKEGVSL